MKKIFSLIFLFLLLGTQAVFAQFETVDAKVRSYPNFSDADKLAERINADFDTEAKKARAIYTWIATNVSYDMKAFYAQQNGSIAFSYTTPEDRIQKERAFRLNLVKKTMHSGKAICEGYASLFTYLCAMTDLQAVIIPGTSKTSYTEIGKIPTEGDHTWNAVKIGGQWQLIDVTWAAGVVKGSESKFTPFFNDAYFFTDPDLFFLNHYPDDKRWLLTPKSAQVVLYHEPRQYARPFTGR
jgi:transglutaminase/protease-like cytokinesis protein 3